MVSSISATLLKDPVEHIQSTFYEDLASKRPSASNDYGIPHLFERAFDDEAEFAKVPLMSDMTSKELSEANGRLVRAVCYVVHSDTEIFGGAFRTTNGWHLGRYGLDSAIDVHISEDDLVFEERTSLQCRLLDLASKQNLTTELNRLSLSADASSTAGLTKDFQVKLYNEKEEGLLHACLDIIGVLEVVDEEYLLHSLITKNQRLASMMTSKHSSATIPPDTRAEIVQKLEEALGGDGLAAELALMCLISEVVTRSPILLGTMSLNLRKVDTDVATKLCSVVRELTANSFCYTMSIDNLNKARLFPSHDGESFSSGAMQLPADSTVVLNECVLSEGTLDETGVKNLQCLANTIDTQDLIFHFPYNEFKIPVDLSIITLSQGKSLLPSTISIPLKKSSVWTLNGKSTIGEMQHYLARCRMTEVEISEGLGSEIQEDFVNSRKQGRPMDQEDLSMSLALGKGIARSSGRRQMNWEDYQYAQKLRSQIVERSQHLSC